MSSVMVYESRDEQIAQIVCYILIGPLILISNCPIVYVILTDRVLLKRYAVITVLFLNCILTGNFLLEQF